MKNSFDNLILDFDGTLVNLNIDWEQLREEISKGLERYNLLTCGSLTQDILLLKKYDSKVLDAVYKFETCDQNPNYNLIERTLQLIQAHNSSFFIISNNHSSTIKDILEKESLLDQCMKIIGIDHVNSSKPDKEAFMLIKKYLAGQNSIYIGDKLTDKMFAENCGLNFKYVYEI